jgi:signal transduction histidine kinase
VAAVALWHTAQREIAGLGLTVADGMARFLKDPARLDEVSPEAVFEVRAGVLQDADLRWAEAAESLGGEWLASDPQWRDLDAAWRAWRDSGDRSWRDRYANPPPSPPPVAVVAGILLLHASAQEPVPSWARALVPQMPAERARAVQSRFAELAPSAGVLVPDLERSLSVAELRRAALRVVRASLPRLLEANEPLLLGRDGHLITWHPALGRGSAVRSPSLEPRADSDPLLVVEPLPEAAVAIGPGVGIVTGSVEWEILGTLTAVLAGLVLAFLLGLGLLLRMLRREHAAVAARADFLISVTHELKTPLASIRLLGEMLGDAPPDKRAEYLAMLEGESARLAALVENVLDLGRLERKERAYDKRPQSLAELVRAVVRGFAPVATNSGVDVQLDESGEPAEADVDRDAIAQALLNVLENARRYAAAGGRITVATALGRDGFEIRVRDHGPGIPADERERIFERFRRGRAQRDGSVPGLGIGLHLARTILRDHGGDLRCIPPPDGGRGACFLFTLAVRAGAAT